MAKNKVKVYIDPVGDTINVWWGNPKDAFISVESEGEDMDVIVKDKKGKLIGFEKIGFFPQEIDPIKKFLKNPQTFYLSEG